MEIRKIVDQIIQQAILAHASDIFLLPNQNKYHLNLRLRTGVMT